MIDATNVRAAFARFKAALELSTAQAQTHEERIEAGDAIWQSVGLTPELRVDFYERAEELMGAGFTDPDSLLFGALWALMAAAENGSLVVAESVDWDAAAADLLGGR